MFSGSLRQFYLTMTSRSVRYLCAFIGYLTAVKTEQTSSDKSSGLRCSGQPSPVVCNLNCIHL